MGFVLDFSREAAGGFALTLMVFALIARIFSGRLHARDPGGADALLTILGIFFTLASLGLAMWAGIVIGSVHT